MTIGDIAKGAHPLLPDGSRVPDAPTVQGTPVFYSADELADALGCPDVDSGDEDASSHPSLRSPESSGDEDDGTAADVVGWVEPGDEGDVRRHSPDESQWWFIESPDALYRDVRRLSHSEWAELDDADYTLVGFGRTVASEVSARSHLAAVVARSSAGGVQPAPWSIGCDRTAAAAAAASVPAAECRGSGRCCSRDAVAAAAALVPGHAGGHRCTPACRLALRHQGRTA